MPQFLVTVAAAGTPVQAAANPTNARTLLLIGAKSIAGPTASANTGKVKVGFSATTANQPLEIAPGAVQSVAVSEGCMDLSQFWVDALNNGDGLVFWYV